MKYTLTMINRSIKRRVVKTRIALNQTIHQILNINRRRKGMHALGDETQPGQAARLEEELRVLNKVAEQQAQMLRRLENSLDTSAASDTDHNEQFSEKSSPGMATL